jgi:hypothetical protein
MAIVVGHHRANPTIADVIGLTQRAAQPTTLKKQKTVLLKAVAVLAGSSG